MRWLRSLWIKAVAVLALLPVAAGGIFKAGVTLGAFFAGEGLLSLLVRLLWLWGATGFLLALAGVLGKVTLSASVEALGQLTRGVKAMVSTAVLAGSAAGGGGLAAGPGVGGGVSGGGPGGLSAAVGGSGSEYGGEILGRYDRAEALTRSAGTLGALGLQGPAQYARTQARTHELAARKLELQRRLSRFAGNPGGRVPDGRIHEDRVEDDPTDDSGEAAVVPDFGFSRTVNQRIATAFSNTVTGFEEGFAALSKHIDRAGFDPQVVAERYPEDVGRMVQVYLYDPEAVESAENPLLGAAVLGGAEGFIADVFGAAGQLAEAPSEDGIPG
jgi:hypothetical protein